MFNFIFETLIHLLFRTNIQRLKDTYYNKGVNEASRKNFDNRVNFEKEQFHNRFVINICESDVNPVVGYVVDWCDSIPIIKDVVSGETLLCGGVMLHYSEEALRAVCLLAPNQRYNLLAKREVWTPSKTRLDVQAVSVDEIIRCVNEDSGIPVHNEV